MNTAGTWVSNIDINGNNLNVIAGESLPEMWQNPTMTSYLKKMYGDDAITFKHETGKNEFVKLKERISLLEERVERLYTSIDNIGFPSGNILGKKIKKGVN